MTFSVACFLSMTLLLHGLRHDRGHAARVTRIRITGIAEIQLRRTLGNGERLDVAGAGAGQAIPDDERLAERGPERRFGHERVDVAASRCDRLGSGEHAEQSRAARVVRPRRLAAGTAG